MLGALCCLNSTMPILNSIGMNNELTVLCISCVQFHSIIFQIRTAPNVLEQQSCCAFLIKK